jgi:Holliday junction resolvase
MTNSREKGARGEREFTSLCREQGYDVRRGQQYNGLEGEDVVGLPGIHVEVKRVQALNIEKAMSQSRRDSTREQLPIVAHRKNNSIWLVTMDADDWFDLYREWEAGKALLQVNDNNQI